MKLSWNRTLSVCLVAAVTIATAMGQAPPGYTISTVAGVGTAGYTGEGGAATAAELNFPFAIARNAAGNVYIADTFNFRIRYVDTGGTIRLLAGNGDSGFQGDGGQANVAEFTAVYGIVADNSGNIYFSDTQNHVVRRITSGGVISTFAGRPNLPGYTGDGFAATEATLSAPTGLAYDPAGYLYIADTFNNRVRRVDLNTNVIATSAGNGQENFSGDGGFGFDAALNRPVAVAVGPAGNLYIADTNNHRIRLLDNSTGVITTVAGSGTVWGYGGDGGPATQALLAYPRGIAVDASGRVYFADSLNHRVRAVMENGLIYTIAGSGFRGYAGDDGPATNAILNFPRGLAIDSATGRIWFADTDNSRIRLLTPVPQTPLISQGGVISAANFGGFGTAAPGTWLELYGNSLASRTREWSEVDFVDGMAPTSLGGTSVTIDGREAYLSYVSHGQVNLQVPSDVLPGEHSIVVHTSAGDSAAYPIVVEETQPGLLAPAAFKIGDRQYTVGVFADGSFAMPAGSVPGANTRPARPGETVTFYGIGFGPVTPLLNAGEVTTRTRTLTLPFSFSIGDATAVVTYAGLTPGALGLYQLNVTVPAIPAGDAIPVRFRLDGSDSEQTLYIAVGQ